MIKPIPDYKNLDLSGEALQAAARMEARANEPTSDEMFTQLVAPLLSPELKTVLEFGCGTAVLARRIATAAPQAEVYASDKSEGMLKVARHMLNTQKIKNIHLAAWDILDEAAFPFAEKQFDLIISSVVIPYLDDAQTISLIHRLSSRLSPKGVLAFMEQDWFTDSVNIQKAELFRAILAKDSRELKLTLALGLRPILREAGLQVLPRRSFLWADDAYGEYTRDLLERFADAAYDRGDIKLEQRDDWKMTLDELARSGDFFYGLVYHLVAGRHI